MEGCVIATELDGGVAIVRMDDGTTNALSHAFVDMLCNAFARISRDARVHAVVLAGRTDYFSSGAAADVLDDLVARRREPTDLLLPRVLLECPVPCIAAMEGHAIGGGFALGVAADLVVLAAESRYCLNFTTLGFSPGMGTTRLLEHVLTPAVAHELLYTGEARRGRDFTGMNHIVPRSEVLPRARDLAARIADKPRLATTLLKRTLSLPRRLAFETARTHEALMHQLTFPDAAPLVAEIFERTS
jgi:polyketide biosynthesis enoyl-CoA hydratase PksI